MNKYILEDVILRNSKIDISKINQIEDKILNLNKDITKEENKILSSIKLNLKRNFGIENEEDLNRYEDGILGILNKEIVDEKTVEKLEKSLNDLIILEQNFKLSINDLEKYKSYLSPVIYLTYLKMKEDLNKINSLKLYEEIENPLIEILADMQFRGIKINEEKLDLVGNNLKEELQKIEEKIISIAGYSLNVSSTQQIGELLFEKLGLKVLKKTKTGYATDVETLKKLENDHEVIKYILEYRELAKLISTYINGLKQVINSKTKKIHSNLNQTGTATRKN